jgi:glycosyltransferase involved in cell wall biosynthesis
MTELNPTLRKMKALECCVIIPTYNNETTLARVISEVAEYCEDIIVVDDGSDDNTPTILSSTRGIDVVRIPVNGGKGNALQAGFRRAVERNFRYAVTIDSDGQHYADDMPALVEMIAAHPDSLIIGARNMDQSGVPGGSSFGHRFSVFWYRVETGLRIADVQSGYRLYPLDKIRDIRFYTTKYEFEVEVLVRAAWRGIPVISVPVKVYYAPKETRVSHFRKYRDFGRTTVLNTILVFIALLWVRPMQFLRDLRQKSIRSIIKEYILDSADTNERLAISVAVGAFFSSFPVWGWQMVIALSVAYALKLNKFVVLVSSNLSVPPMIPVLIFLSYFTGGLILGSQEAIAYAPGISFNWIKHNILQYFVGSVVFSIVLGVTLGLISYILLRIFRKGATAEGVNLEDDNG